VALDLTILAVVFVLGLAILAYGLASAARSLPSSLTRTIGGSTIAILSGVTIDRLRPAIKEFKPGIAGDVALAIVAWTPAALIGACAFKYRLGPRGLPGRIALSAISVLFVGILISEIHNLPQIGGLLLWLMLPLAVLLLVGRYPPASGWRIWIRRTAFASLAALMGSAFVWWRSAAGRTHGSFVWGINLGFRHWVNLPFPYSYYAYQLTKYLGLVSLLLTVVFSAVCLCVWLFDTLSRKSVILSEAKNLH